MEYLKLPYEAKVTILMFILDVNILNTSYKAEIFILDKNARPNYILSIGGVL